MEIQRSKAIEIQQIEIQQTPFGLGFVDLSNHGQEKKEEKRKNLLQISARFKLLFSENDR
jgi:hypothetical protein